MLYYHFHSKQDLYRAMLRSVFSEAAARLSAIAESEGSSAGKIDRVVASLAEFIREHGVFPAIMLREVADAGAHLDRDTLRALVAVPRAFFVIVQQGIEDGSFRRVDPLVTYFSVLAPLVFYLAAGPIRRQVSSQHLMKMTALSPDEFVRQLQDALARVLVADSAGDRS